MRNILVVIALSLACSSAPDRQSEQRGLPLSGPTDTALASRPVADAGSSSIDAQTSPTPDAGPSVSVRGGPPLRQLSGDTGGDRLIRTQAELDRLLTSAPTFDFKRGVAVVIGAGLINGRNVEVAQWSRRGTVLQAEVVTTPQCTGGANRGDNPIPTLYWVLAPGVSTLEVTNRVAGSFQDAANCGPRS